MRPRAVLFATCCFAVISSHLAAQELEPIDASSVRATFEALRRKRDWRDAAKFQIATGKSDFSFESPSDEMLAEIAPLLAVYPELRTLDLSNSPVSDSGLRHVAGFKTLETLVLTGTAVTDKGMKHISELPKLSTLYLNSTRITDEGVAQLKSLPALEELHLFGTEVTSASLESFSAMKSLRALSIAKTKIKFSAFELAGPKGIKTLYLDTSQFRGFMPERYHVTIFHPAISFRLHRSGFDAEVFYAANDGPQSDKLFYTLKRLHNTNPEKAFDPLPPSPPVKVVSSPRRRLSHLSPFVPPFRVTDPERVSLDQATAEELLYVERSADEVVELKLTRTGVDLLLQGDGQFDRLQSLTLADCRFYSYSLEFLKAPKLRRLELSGARVTDDHLAAIDGDLCGLLRELRLNISKVTDRGIAELIRCESLERLDLSETAVGDASLAEISKLKKLEKLNLEFTRVTDQGLSQLGNLESLQDLNLSHTAISDAGLRALVNCRGLLRLDVRATRVTPAGTARLQLKRPEIEVTE